MPTLMNRDYEAKDIILAIRAFTPIDSIPVQTALIMIDYKSLYDCVTYLNSDAFEKLLDAGQLPSYLLINKILTNMKFYKTRGRIMAHQELEKMLTASITIGVQLDREQLNIISTLGQNVLDIVMKDYEIPYWRKICKASHKIVPQRLRQLAISLNIDPDLSQTAICDNISKLAKSDKEAIKDAAKKRQQLRMSSNLGHIYEFQNEHIPNLTCSNKTLLLNDPFDYNDIDIAYYRDDQGDIWCFTSDSFDSLLENGLNPYNSTTLPQSLKDQLYYKIDILKKLDLYRISSPITLSTAIDNLSLNDSVSEKNSEQVVNNFIHLANRYNVNIDIIKNLSKDSMMVALNSIGYNVDLTSLVTSHALITTAYIIEYVNQIDPETIKHFFNSINFKNDHI